MDAFVRTREEDPITQDELSVGELIAIAKYHLDYIIGLAASGRCDSDGNAQSVASHLEEVLMTTAQTLSLYRKKEVEA